VKYPFFLSGFNRTLINFVDAFSKKSYIPNFIRIFSVEAEFFSCGLTDGRADMTKIVVTFRNLANAPKSSLLHTLCPSILLTSCISAAPTLGFYVKIVKFYQEISDFVRTGQTYRALYINMIVVTFFPAILNVHKRGFF
jgi:hypothetical protein